MNDDNKLKILKAVASDNRFLILKLLHKNKEMSVGDLAEKINTPIRSMSKNLRVLRQASLVQFRKKFVRKYYFIDLANFPKELLNFLDN
jgi:DNA-binding transcriptional ArsR family regulator